MTKEQLDALIEYVREIADVAVNDPLGSNGRSWQAEKALRAAFELEKQP